MSSGKPKVRPISQPDSVLLERGLPCNLDAERFVLGSILLDGERFNDAAALDPDDFSLEKHRRIFRRIRELHARGEHIDRLTVAEELAQHGELEQVDGLSYLVSLDDGMPRIRHLDSYVRIVRNKSTMRRMILTAQKVMNTCVLGQGTPGEILAGHLAEVQQIIHNVDREMRVSHVQPFESYADGELVWVVGGLFPRGTVIMISGESGHGKSTFMHAASMAIANGEDFMGRATTKCPVLILERENSWYGLKTEFARIGFKSGPNLIVWGGWCEQEAPGPISPAVLQWVKEHPDTLIFFDSYTAFNTGESENDSVETRRFIHQFRQLADQGATIIFSHHPGKDPEKLYRGSSDIKASVDLAYEFRNQDASGRGYLDRLSLKSFKNRFGGLIEIAIQYSDGLFLVDSTARSKTVTEKLSDLLNEHPGVATRDFLSYALALGLSKQRAHDFLRKGVRDGTVTLQLEGCTHRHWAQHMAPGFWDQNIDPTEQKQ